MAYLGLWGRVFDAIHVRDYVPPETTKCRRKIRVLVEGKTNGCG